MKEACVKRNTVYECDFLKVHEDDVILENQELAKRVVIDHVGGAAVVPLTKNNEVIMVKQYRYAIGKYTLEIPAGKKDLTDEDGLSCALRECLEETGYTGEDIVKLGEVYSSVGFCNEVIEIFALYDAVKMPKRLSVKGEELEVVLMPLDEVLQMVRRGKIRDAKTVIALLSL